MADDYQEDEQEVTEHPRHEAQRQANRAGGRFATGQRGTSGYMKPKRQVYQELDKAFEGTEPPVKSRRP